MASDRSCEVEACIRILFFSLAVLCFSLAPVRSYAQSGLKVNVTWSVKVFNDCSKGYTDESGKGTLVLETGKSWTELTDGIKSGADFDVKGSGIIEFTRSGCGAPRRMYAAEDGVDPTGSIEISGNGRANPGGASTGGDLFVSVDQDFETKAAAIGAKKAVASASELTANADLFPNGGSSGSIRITPAN